MKRWTVDALTLACAMLIGGCSGGGGSEDGSSLDPAPTANLSANPARVASGGSTQLSWSSTNASSCSASGGWSGSKAAAGTETVSVQSETSFSLRCSGAGGDSPTASVTVALASGSSACEADAPATADCAGVPAGTQLTELPLNESNAYRASVAGHVIDGRHIAGDLVIAADNVIVRNSRIDGRVTRAPAAASGGAQKANATSTLSSMLAGPFTISDSTIGRPAATVADCVPAAAISGETYTATRVHVLGFAQAFEVTGPDVTIRDSFAQVCRRPGSNYYGGIGANGATVRNLVVDHNTIDLCGAWTADRTQPCTLLPTLYAVRAHEVEHQDISITGNLFVGGDASVDLSPGVGIWTVTGNRIADGLETFASRLERGSCDDVQWADNAFVTIDGAYNITSTVAPAACTRGPFGPRITLSADPMTVAPGGSTTLTWSTIEATSCTAFGGWSGARAVSGTQTFDDLQAITMFSLRCAGPRTSDAITSVSVVVAHGNAGCQPPAHTTSACSGVPPGTLLTDLPPNNGNLYQVTVAGTVIDRRRVLGSLWIMADNVIITNSVIDGVVFGQQPYTIVDSTVGPATGCAASTGLSGNHFTAVRVHVRGQSQAFSVINQATIRDSYAKLCNAASNSNPPLGLNGDNLRVANVVFDHNTIDLCGPWTTDRSQPCALPGQPSTALFIANDPTIFPVPHERRITLTNNLIVGGSRNSIHLWPRFGDWTVTGNRIVQGVSNTPAMQGLCANVQWSDNTLVTIDAAYAIQSTTGAASCPP